MNRLMVKDVMKYTGFISCKDTCQAPSGAGRDISRCYRLSDNYDCEPLYVKLVRDPV